MAGDGSPITASCGCRPSLLHEQQNPPYRDNSAEKGLLAY